MCKRHQASTRQKHLQGNAKMASKAETFRTKKLANGFVLSDHEHEKSELINMTKNCEKSQVTQKIVRLTIFRNFCKLC